MQMVQAMIHRGPYNQSARVYADNHCVLGHARLSDAELKGNKKCRLNFEYGKPIYEIEFHANGFTYAYDIDASSGRLIKTSQEIWD